MSPELLKNICELYAIQAQIKEYDAYWLDSNVKVLRDEKGRFTSKKKTSENRIVKEAKILDKATQEILSPQGIINNLSKLTSIDQDLKAKVENIVDGFDNFSIPEKIKAINSLYGLEAQKIIDSTLNGFNKAKKQAKENINDTYKKIESNIQKITGKDIENSVQDFLIKHKILKERNIGEEIANVDNLKEAQELTNKYLSELTTSVAVASLATKMALPSVVAAGLLFTAPELLAAIGVGASVAEMLGIAGVGVAEAAVTDMAGGTLADLSRKFGDTENSAALAGIRLGGSLLASVAVAGRVGAWKKGFIKQAEKRNMDKGLQASVEKMLSNNEKQLANNVKDSVLRLKEALGKKNNTRNIESLLIYKFKVFNIKQLESLLGRKLTSTEKKMAKRAFDEFKKLENQKKKLGGVPYPVND